MLARPVFWVSAGSIALVIAACGSDNESLFGENNDAGLFDGSLGGGDGANLGGDSSLDPDAFTACATDMQKAKLLPLDLYIMLDTSGSMAELVSATQTKWNAVKAAVTAFVNDTGSAGFGVGIQFFPVDKAGVPASCTTSTQCSSAQAGLCLVNLCTPPPGGNVTACDPTATKPCPGSSNCVPAGQCSIEKNIYCINFGTPCGNDRNGFNAGTCQQLTTSYCTQSDSCVAADYAKPAAAVAALPGASATIVAALGAKQPEGDTPTSAALNGAVTAAKAYATANPGHSVVAVLATDGLPTECDTNIDNIAAIANGARTGTPSIKTFVIGVFAPAEASIAQTNLGKIATAGGTTSVIIQTNQNIEQQFLTALNTIRGTALPCDYNLPIPESGTPDYNKVNVEYTNPTGQKVVLPYVKSAANCGTTGGWYYDADPATGAKPTKIILCSNTCDKLKSAAGQGSVEVVQGCSTYTNIK
jgi:Mg-chelatase subunit ChlD